VTWSNIYKTEDINVKYTTALTTQDSTIVQTRYRYIVATRMLYRDYLGLKHENTQQLYTIQQLQIQNKELKKSNVFLFRSDSLSREKMKLDSLKTWSIEKDLLNTKSANRRNKTGKIIGYIAIPVVAVVSFIVGFKIAVSLK